MRRDFYEMKEEIKNFNDKQKFKLYIKQCYLIVWSVKKNRKWNPKVVKTKNGRIMLLAKFTVCNSAKLKFIKKQEARGLISKLTGIKLPVLNDLPIVSILF